MSAKNVSYECKVTQERKEEGGCMCVCQRKRESGCMGLVNVVKAIYDKHIEIG